MDFWKSLRTSIHIHGSRSYIKIFQSCPPFLVHFVTKKEPQVPMFVSGIACHILKIYLEKEMRINEGSKVEVTAHYTIIINSRVTKLH